MRIFKLIIFGIILTIWLLASIAYLALGEWIGFYFTQLFFVPLIAGLLMLYFNKILGFITLSFWFAMIYGFVNLPFRDIVKFFPITLLLFYFIRFSIIVEDKSFKILGYFFSALSLVAFIRALKIQGMFNTDIIIPIGLFIFPIIIFYKSLQIIKSQKRIGIIVMAMSIIVFLQLSVRFINIPTFLDISVAIIMILSLGLTSWVIRKKLEFKNINKVTLAYFVFVIFINFALWIANTIESIK